MRTYKVVCDFCGALLQSSDNRGTIKISWQNEYDMCFSCSVKISKIIEPMVTKK